MNTYEEKARDEASGFCGREITDKEWAEALPAAQRKLDWIINREGDCNGERRKPYYLGKLVEEHINTNAFAAYCAMMSEINIEKRRMANETVPAHS